MHLDALGRLLADGQVVLALHVRDDRLVHLVAADAHALRVDDAGERDDGDLGRAAADVDDHVAARLGDGQARADGRRHGLLDQVDLARAGALGALLHRALLDLGDAEGHADDDARLHQRAPVVRAGDEVAQHRLGDLEVGDDAVAQRADRLDVARRAAEHLLGLAADGEHLLAAARVALHRDDRGLARDDALALDVDERVGRPEIDREIVREQAVEPVEDHLAAASRIGALARHRPAGICPRRASGVAITATQARKRSRLTCGKGAPLGITPWGQSAIHPFEIFPSLWGKCLRHDGQYFLISNFSAMVRLFLVVW